MISAFIIIIISDSASDFNTTALLTPENMREVLDLTFPYRAKWRQIGIQLGIDIGKIDAIEANRRMVEDCLTDLISHWLRNTKPKPTRGVLTAVLQSEHVSGNNRNNCDHPWENPAYAWDNKKYYCINHKIL